MKVPSPTGCGEGARTGPFTGQVPVVSNPSQSVPPTLLGCLSFQLLSIYLSIYIFFQSRLKDIEALQHLKEIETKVARFSILKKPPEQLIKRYQISAINHDRCPQGLQWGTKSGNRKEDTHTHTHTHKNFLRKLEGATEMSFSTDVCY